MARIRTIKPDFFTSGDILNLSLLARLLYIGLWCEADREGRMTWNPRTFKMRYLPAETCKIEKVCAELTDAGLVIEYGPGFAYIPTFALHQHVNPRESESRLPAPSEELTRQARVSDATVTHREEWEGRERKGREGEGSNPPDGVTLETWADFTKLRKAKRAPITDTAIKGIQLEADKAGMTLEAALQTCCQHGWQGFDASWLNKTKPANKQESLEARNRKVAEEWAKS